MKVTNLTSEVQKLISNVARLASKEFPLNPALVNIIYHHKNFKLEEIFDLEQITEHRDINHIMLCS